ncbi:hypothetical protein VD0004_g3541 [Verticillium dahliae]|nr:hypothetical protein VD0004_g3541 [Verticillium dahliae]PNH74008.1 hypothetical protein VD0001_g3577 [Verticillium dahliae]
MDAKTAASHAATVQSIAAAVKTFHARRQPFRIHHGSTNSTRPAHGQPVVDISALNHVLHVDKAAKTVSVEPNVAMDGLLDAVLPHNLVPPVVMEFPGITAGGAFAGSAGESSSFRHGAFDAAVTCVEMVLANGDIIEASPTQNADLFAAAPGALGTLGIVTRLDLRLLDAESYVRVEYSLHTTVEATCAAVEAATHVAANDFVEGILFCATQGLVITGTMSRSIPIDVTLRTFSHARDPWFYLHARDRAAALAALRKGQAPPPADYLPLRDYLFRYDRGGFWTGALAFAYFRPLVPFTPLTRRLLNPLMRTRNLYRAGLGGGSRMTFRYLVHDLAVPYAAAPALVDHLVATNPVWPLWLCPLPAIATPTFHPATDPPGAPSLNVGVWGRGPHDLEAFVRTNRDLEAKVRALGGRKVLYSHAYYDEDDFWAIYGRAWYDELRLKYHATTLPTVYDKVRVDIEKERAKKGLVDRLAVKWPFAGLIGVASALRS